MCPAQNSLIDESQRVTRLAPSPTGALHLGNARTFLINWALARRQGWRIALRIDDLDSPRVKDGADRGAIEDLEWLGLDWDGQPTYQTTDLSHYHAALDQLRRQELTYTCTCTRREIAKAQSAPHEEEDQHELRYPGTCRPDAKGLKDQGSNVATATDPQTAIRVLVPDEPVVFVDEVAGPQKVHVQQQVGDFIVASKQGLPAYQLAVVVDDSRAGVTDVVRGNDLVRSTGRQIWLYRMLNLTPLPRYWHLPLVRGDDGRRLAKRHGDTRIAFYREQGVKPERIIGLLAAWSGVVPQPTEMSTADFRDGFKLYHLPQQDVTFTPEHHAWLIG